MHSGMHSGTHSGMQSEMQPEMHSVAIHLHRTYHGAARREGHRNVLRPVCPELLRKLQGFLSVPKRLLLTNSRPEAVLLLLPFLGCELGTLLLFNGHPLRVQSSRLHLRLLIAYLLAPLIALGLLTRFPPLGSLLDLPPLFAANYEACRLGHVAHGE